MLNHSEFTERFSAFLEEDLDATEAASVKSHLAECRECTAQFDLLKLTVEGLHRLEPYQAPPELARKVRRRVRRRGGGWLRPMPKTGQQEIVAAAILAILIGSAVAVSGRLLTPGVDEIEPLQTVTSLGGGERVAAQASVQAWVVLFSSTHQDAADAFVANAADFGATDLDGLTIRPGTRVGEEGQLLVVPKAALSVIVPEGVAHLEQVPSADAPSFLGEDADPSGVPEGWVVLRVVVR